MTLLVWWLEAYLLWSAGPFAMSTYTAGGWQLQQAESPVLPAGFLLFSAGAVSFHRQCATGVNPEGCSVLSCLMPCRKAVHRVLIPACCLLVCVVYLPPRREGRLIALSQLTFSFEDNSRDVF